MDRSVAQGRPADPPTLDPKDRPWSDHAMLAAGLLLAVAAVAIYLLSRADRFYDHFVWQAAAYLEGHAAIRYPVAATAERVGNAFFQDVLPIASADGVARGLLPFPPLPAVLLVPFVAIWGLDTDAQTIFTVLAGVDVAICFWMLGQLRIGPSARIATTVFFAFGTVFWYTAQVSTTWYQAHIAAVGLTMLAIGLNLGGDRTANEDGAAAEPVADAEAGPVAEAGPRPARDPAATGRSTWRTVLASVDVRQFGAGLLFGLACTARLTVVFGAPFFVLVGRGGGSRRRGWSAGLGASLPIAAVLLYNAATTGHLLHPAYDYLYQLESRAYTGLGYQPTWAIEDPRYLPQNARLMFLSSPDILPTHLPDSLGVRDDPVCTDPAASRGLFDLSCPLAVPRDVGMSVLLTSPALLLLLPAVGWYGRRRVVTGAVLASLLIIVANLMHFSQGWVQFGYRFANDALPFVLLLVGLGVQQLVDGRRRWAMPLALGLVVVSIAVNAWGVIWSSLLGW